MVRNGTAFLTIHRRMFQKDDNSIFVYTPLFSDIPRVAYCFPYGP